MTRLRLALGICALGLSLGCFRYVPATLDTAPLGSHVQALLSTEGQIALRNRIGIDRPLLRGELLDRDGETVLLSVRSTGLADEFGGRQPLHQRVDILKSHSLRIDQRQLDPVRTGGIVAAAGGAATLILVGSIGERNPGQVDNTGGGPDESIRSWILRLPLSIR